ncbi:MAG TPA: hypothetical protein VGV38_15870 [Pyrinomonadaceae bacterium]|nr:hypothetical protein [Pyrinomonadaceae bacterium]
MFGLDSIGNMFGLDKLFSSLGMPWLSDIITLAGNVMTGNWLGAAKDVFDLVSQFSSSSWANRVDPFQPLGDFGFGSGGGGCFDLSRLTEIAGSVGEQGGFDFSSVSRAFSLVEETVFNNSLANESLRLAHARSSV